MWLRPASSLKQPKRVGSYTAFEKIMLLGSALLKACCLIKTILAFEAAVVLI